MLVGSRMQHDDRLEIPEYFFHLLRFRDRSDHCCAGDFGISAHHHQADVMLGRFRLVDQHHFAGVQLGNLAHDFAADAAGRARNQHLLSLEGLSDGLHIDHDLVPGQEIVDARFAQGGCLVRYPFREMGHEDFDPRIQDVILQFAVFTKPFDPIVRDQHGIDVAIPQDLRQLGVDIEYRFPEEVGPLRRQTGVMGNEPAQLKALRLLGTDDLGQTDAAVADAVDHHVLRVSGSEIGIEDQFHHNPIQAHQSAGDDFDRNKKGKSEMDEELARHKSPQQVQRKENEQSPKENKEDLVQILERRMPHDPPVSPENPKQDEKHRQFKRDGRCQGFQVRAQRDVPVPIPVDRITDERDDEQIHQQDHPVRQRPFRKIGIRHPVKETRPQTSLLLHCQASLEAFATALSESFP